MKSNNSSDRVRDYRKKLKEQGFVKIEVWLTPDEMEFFSRFRDDMRMSNIEAAKFLMFKSGREIGLLDENNQMIDYLNLIKGKENE